MIDFADARYIEINYMTLNKYFLIVIFCFVVKNTNAQNGFSLSLVTGVNAAQIAGDALSGYNKIGLQSGLKLGYIIGNKWDMNLDFIFTQKGSQPRWSDFNINERSTTLSYAEIPVYVTFNDWWIEDSEYYKVGLNAGLAYGRLISAKAGNGAVNDQVDNFKNFDLSFLFGAQYAFSKRWQIGLRYTNSMVRIYSDESLTNDGLINYLWSLRLEFKL